MTVEPSKDLLRRLTLAAGPPGAEEEVRGVVREALEEIGSIEHDRLGSILCEKKGDGDAPRVILDAHLDEVGFMVRSISREGRVRFVPLGGWWGHVLLAQRVEIITDGGKVPGVIASKPPHFLSSEERGKVLPLDSMTIDVGASTRDEVEELGVRTGDCIVPVAEFREMALSGLLSSKAFDDRAGVGVMVETLLALKDRAHPNTVVGVGAVQEEVGCRGAGTASELSRPDVAIILEGTPADDLPGSDEPQAALG
ncbi:MAG: M42 family metallopeptidase, partial [Planctomycetota bacterium]